jgi:hypothetical protein
MAKAKDTQTFHPSPKRAERAFTINAMKFTPTMAKYIFLLIPTYS